jgi:TRAP-type mannitol/chloroaromatic compound transport system permease small subunit
MRTAILRAIVSKIEQVSQWTGKAVSWLMVVLVLEVSYDVIMRYVFNEPTVWSYDISYMLSGTVIMLAAAWVMVLDQHIALDVLSNRFTTRTKLSLDVVFFTVCVLPMLYFLLQHSITVTWRAVSIFEQSNISYWRAYIWPYRIIVSAGFLLLIVQSIATLIRKLYLLTGSEL